MKTMIKTKTAMKRLTTTLVKIMGLLALVCAIHVAPAATPQAHAQSRVTSPQAAHQVRELRAQMRAVADHGREVRARLNALEQRLHEAELAGDEQRADELLRRLARGREYMDRLHTAWSELDHALALLEEVLDGRGSAHTAVSAAQLVLRQMERHELGDSKMRSRVNTALQITEALLPLLARQSNRL